MEKRLIFLFLGLTLTLSLFSQSIVLEKVYNWSTYDILTDFISTDDGGYAISGFSENHRFVMKLDSNGDSLWTYIIDQDGGYAWQQTQIIQSMNSDLIIASQLDENAWLLRLSISGDSISSIIWPNSYDENSFISVLEQNNGDLVVSHKYEQNGGNAPPIVFLRCFSSDGILKWTHGLGNSYPYSVILTTENEIAMTGWNDPWDMNIWIAKFDSVGNTIYSYNMGGEQGKQLIESTSGDLYALVDGYSAPQGTYNAIKLSSDGTEQWKLYDNNGLDGSAYTICELEPNHFAIGGARQGALSIKVFNENGDSLIFFTYDEYYSQHARRIFTDEEYLIVGGSKKEPDNNRSILILKILLDSLYTGNNQIFHKNHNIPVVFPNPAKEIIDFSRFQDNGEHTTVKVFDLNGKLQFTEYFGVRNPLILNVEILKPGNYIARVYSKNNTSYFKFIIAK